MPFEDLDQIRLDSIRNAVPLAARVTEIRHALMDSAAPVRTLPSNAFMMLAGVATFVTLAVLLTIPAGFFGLAALSAIDRFLEFLVLLLLAFVLTGSLVEQMVPGSRRTVPPAFGALLGILLLSATASLLFPNFEMRNFVRQGIPCLKMGMLCAIPAGGLIWAMLRRGCVVDEVSAMIAAGTLSGLLGVSVLALHCPVFNAAHIIGWHMSVIFFTSIAGGLGGLALARR